MRKRTLYWILAALFAASAIYAPFDDNRDSGLPLTIVTIIALVALAVGFAMAARKVDPEARFKKKPKSVTKMKSKPVKAKDLMVDNYTSIDLETTGFSPSDDRIVEIGAIRVRNGRPVKRYSQLINPQRPLPEEITRLNGLTDADLRNQPTVDQVLPDFIRFIGNDTLPLDRALYPEEPKHRLVDIIRRFGIAQTESHRAADDALQTAQCYETMKAYMKANGIK